MSPKGSELLESHRHQQHLAETPFTLHSFTLLICDYLEISHKMHPFVIQCFQILLSDFIITNDQNNYIPQVRLVFHQVEYCWHGLPGFLSGVFSVLPGDARDWSWNPLHAPLLKRERMKMRHTHIFFCQVSGGSNHERSWAPATPIKLHVFVGAQHFSGSGREATWQTTG